MTVKNLVGTLTHGAVSGAVSAVRHPVGTTARAVGLVKGVAEAGIDLVRGEAADVTATPAAAPEHEEAAQAAAQRAEEHEETTVPQQRAAEPESTTQTQSETESQTETETLAGPPLREPLPAAPQRTPEELSRPFTTEPKAATRDSEHGEGPGDREEIEHYAEETLLGADVDVETPVGTTGADVGFNPDTAEADLQQPDTPPLLDPSVAKAVRRETAVLQKGADPHKD